MANLNHRFVFDQSLREIVYRYIPTMMLGGASNIRTADNRKTNLKIDQTKALMGELALPARFVELDAAIDYFIKRREKFAYSRNGDGGIDLIYRGNKFDVKTSIWYQQKPWEDYHLWVRHKEYYPDHIYVGALATFRNDVPEYCYLVGWEYGRNLITDEDGRHYRYYRDLHNMEYWLQGR